MDREKHVDESWKDSVANEKELLNKNEKTFQPERDSRLITPDLESQQPAAQELEHQEEPQDENQNPLEVNFINYISSLIFQTMIFLGELPNPITNETEKNFNQAKFLIDTLLMMREKTKGNLTKNEEDLLNNSIYELQMRYVDLTSKENPQGGG